MKAEDLNRREILILGKNLLLTSLVASVPLGCSQSRPAEKVDWQKELQPLDEKGVASVTHLVGDAFANSEPLLVGHKLNSGSVVDLANGGQLVLTLPDRSVLQLKDETRLQLDLDSQQGGDLTLKYGSLLSVVTSRRRSRHYRIKGVAALVGVKGTVCFLQVFKPGADRDPEIPAQATEYCCICNGAIDYLNRNNETAMSDQAEHHSPYFLYPDGNDIGLIKANVLLNHDDKEIKGLIDHMGGQKHDTSWLKTYHSGY